MAPLYWNNCQVTSFQGLLELSERWNNSARRYLEEQV